MKKIFKWSKAGRKSDNVEQSYYYDKHTGRYTTHVSLCDQWNAHIEELEIRMRATGFEKHEILQASYSLSLFGEVEHST